MTWVLSPICVVQQQQQNIAQLHMAVASMEKELKVNLSLVTSGSRTQIVDFHWLGLQFPYPNFTLIFTITLPSLYDGLR